MRLASAMDPDWDYSINLSLPALPFTFNRDGLATLLILVVVVVTGPMYAYKRRSGMSIVRIAYFAL